MKRLPPLASLEAFVVVAQRGTLKLAAGDLNLSVSALSRRIQSLETYVGRQLFERLPRQLRLTPQGATLIEHIVPLFDRLSHTMALLGREDEVIRLGVLPAFTADWLLPRLHRFEEMHPRISIELDTSPSPLSRLGTGVHAAIVIARRAGDELYRRQLSGSSIAAVCAPAMVDGPLALSSVEDLENHSILLHKDRPEVLGIWLAAQGAEAVRPKRIVYYDSGSLLRQAIAQGRGVGLVLSSPFDQETHGLVRPFGDDVPSPFSFMFICRSTAMLNRGLQHFHDWLFTELKGAETLKLARAVA